MTMTDLSPAAQAVLDAWDEKLNPMVTCLTHDPEREALAAAIRAAVTATSKQRVHQGWPINEPAFCPVDELLAIAHELEALDD